MDSKLPPEAFEPVGFIRNPDAERFRDRDVHAQGCETGPSPGAVGSGRPVDAGVYGGNQETMNSMREDRRYTALHISKLNYQIDAQSKKIAQLEIALQDSERGRLSTSRRFDLLREMYLEIVNKLIGGKRD